MENDISEVLESMDLTQPLFYGLPARGLLPE